MELPWLNKAYYYYFAFLCRVPRSAVVAEKNESEKFGSAQLVQVQTLVLEFSTFKMPVLVAVIRANETMVYRQNKTIQLPTSYLSYHFRP